MLIPIAESSPILSMRFIGERITSGLTSTLSSSTCIVTCMVAYIMVLKKLIHVHLSNIINQHTHTQQGVYKAISCLSSVVSMKITKSQDLGIGVTPKHNSIEKLDIMLRIVQKGP